MIGSEIIIRDKKHSTIVGARWIDNGRRVRLLTGEYVGEVLLRHNFEVLEKVDAGDKSSMAALLSLVWDSD